ncbi:MULTISPECIES: Rz1-like lysis system protein LysC [Enterobacter cloacae complex]|uniref:Rz1-like lysis system protein LysC n=1 Tax=Enterobacter cloacae complex TaxID=354276 RepID=UPI000D0B67E7|nr:MULTISPECIES: Rz1-like lysis system protein LysC [Enterobacter cloacae complex]AVP02529.1 holin [Enterobacter cloacae complex sp. FDA-CDC-AR_0132]MED5696159.1 Rz1-like lysis system protein LysC [Enterobacter ludwigii]
MLCAGCTPERPAPPPVIVYSACPKVSLCPMPGSDPVTNGDLSANIRRLEGALAACALKVETVKDCQDKLDEESTRPASGVN